MNETQSEPVERNKLNRRWWTKFVNTDHYFAGASILGKLKRQEYLDFINKSPIKNSLVLKTDLFVEAKAQEDNYLPDLAQGNRFVGMDISLETVKVARPKLTPSIPGMLFVVCDATSLPFKEAAFDCIISDSTLDHIPISALPDAISGLARVLKSGGKLVLSLNSIFNPAAAIMRKIRNAWNPDWFFSFSISLRKVHVLLRRSGFNIKHSQYILPIHPLEIAFLRLFSGKKVASNLSNKWAFFFHKIVKKAHLSKLFCIQHIVTAKKRD